MFDCTTLTAGLRNGATDGLDRHLGEVRLPPRPPTTEIFDVRFLTPDGDGLLLDLHDPNTGSPAWRISVQAGLGGHPVVLTWDKATLPLGEWRLRSLDGLQRIDVDMTAESTLVITDPLVTALAITTGGLRAVTLHYPPGWSMVSIPVTPVDATLVALFPDALSAFEFSGGYQRVTTLDTCTGYWLNLPTGGTYTITGEVVTQCRAALPVDWSIQGVPISGTRVNNIVQDPVNSLASVFAFEGAYIHKTGHDLLAEGQGFWFDMLTAGQVTLNSAPGGAARPVAVASEAFKGPVLWAQSGDVRQEIHLGVEPDQVTALPPLPPEGVLDARVRVGEVDAWQVPITAEGHVYGLSVQGEDVVLSWNVPAGDAGAWELVLEDRVVSLEGAGQVDLRTAMTDLRLRHLGSTPATYALYANYPNPFNPETTIRYELADTGPVSLRVFDITGQMVRELVSAEQPVGHYQIQWDGRNTAGATAGSGVYFYELHAGSYHSVQKMLLMK